jgi:SAM-dependent methyltransferase
MGSLPDQYTTGDLLDRILAALTAAGHELDPLDPEALSPVEDFHTLGRLATVALADAAGITAEDVVVDLGSGIGGPSRFLARTYGCRVDGIDLTPEFQTVSEDLSRRTGLDDLVAAHVGDATATPFADGAFTVAWSQHVAMNIEDKAGLYAEARRILTPGGRLAFFDIMAGPEQPLQFPVPWADTPDLSFLAPPDEVRGLVEAAGFTVDLWLDLSDDAIAFFEAMAAGPPPNASPVNLSLLIPDFPTKAGNLVQNFRDGRTKLVRAVATAR